jgi:hypothetical protein
MDLVNSTRTTIHFSSDNLKRVVLTAKEFTFFQMDLITLVDSKITVLRETTEYIGRVTYSIKESSNKTYSMGKEERKEERTNSKDSI